MNKSRKKILLMGKSGSGKTSMRSIIFANYLARDTQRLGPTYEVEHTTIQFLGNLTLNLCDCGGQDSFMQNYFSSHRDHLFRNVVVLIYVFDVSSPFDENGTEVQYYRECLEALLCNQGENWKLFCLFHKMDLIPEEQRYELIQERETRLKMISLPFVIQCFPTSIWDESLYKAWSTIANSLIPNINRLEKHLSLFCENLGAEEVVLFEKATFLLIAQSSKKIRNRLLNHSLNSNLDNSTSFSSLTSSISPTTSTSTTSALQNSNLQTLSESNNVIDFQYYERDEHRFEKISNIIKHFKLSCSKFSGLKSILVKNQNFFCLINDFTSNTFVLVLYTDNTIQETVIQINVNAAQEHFEQLIGQTLTE